VPDQKEQGMPQLVSLIAHSEHDVRFLIGLRKSATLLAKSKNRSAQAAFQVAAKALEYRRHVRFLIGLRKSATLLTKSKNRSPFCLGSFLSSSQALAWCRLFAHSEYDDICASLIGLCKSATLPPSAGQKIVHLSYLAGLFQSSQPDPPFGDWVILDEKATTIFVGSLSSS
jgi:hypothetical protein